MITIVGLGPGKADQMTVAAWNQLHAATALILRTGRHPAADDLRQAGVDFSTCDPIYDSAESFEAVYEAIVERVLDVGRRSDVVYAVPGHPMVAESTVLSILHRARAEGLATGVVGSPSFIEAAAEALCLHIDQSLLIVDALSLPATRLHPSTDLLLHQVYDRATASSTKLCLMESYPDDWQVALVRHASVPLLERIVRVPLHAVDRQEIDHLTVIYVPAVPAGLQRAGFGDLVRVMADLRAPNGCPWDQEQDHASLRKWMIEECFEAVDAIDEGDMDGLCEELGDVLLQVVFHAEIAAENGDFDVRDVTDRIVAKLVRRHPHVFGNALAETPEAVEANWTRIKGEEKAHRTSALDGVPRSLPALHRAMEVSRKAVKVGFEWPDLGAVLDKVEEEIRELREALVHGEGQQIAAELGDLLFSLVNVARWRDIDPEAALHGMVARFSARFRHMEASAAADGLRLADLSPDELDRLWEAAKAATPG